MPLSSLDKDLCDASDKGDSTRVETLLQDGADVNAADEIGYHTPLHWASMRGRKGVVAILLRNGANLHTVNARGDTPLHWVSLIGHKELVSIFLQRGADINAVNRFGNTPLHVASLYGRKEVVAILLQRGADVNPTCEYGYTAMENAKRGCQSDTVTLLEKHQFQQNIAAILRNEPAVPEALWSRILGRVIGHPELVYSTLAAKPDLFR